MASHCTTPAVSDEAARARPGYPTVSRRGERRSPSRSPTSRRRVQTRTISLRYSRGAHQVGERVGLGRRGVGRRGDCAITQRLAPQHRLGADGPHRRRRGAGQGDTNVPASPAAPIALDERGDTDQRLVLGGAGAELDVATDSAIRDRRHADSRHDRPRLERRLVEAREEASYRHGPFARGPGRFDRRLQAEQRGGNVRRGLGIGEVAPQRRGAA